jgi:hypothetical protein
MVLAHALHLLGDIAIHSDCCDAQNGEATTAGASPLFGKPGGTRPSPASANSAEALRQAGRRRQSGAFDDASYITGVELAIDGALRELIPRDSAEEFPLVPVPSDRAPSAVRM